MLLPDINVLIYAYTPGSPHHQLAREWWESAMNGDRPIGLAWATVLGFIRLTTHPAIRPGGASVPDSLDRVETWLNQPCVEVLTPGERHAEILIGFLTQLGTAGNLTTDAHLAALAIEYHAELVSTDADFARFPGLRWFNPIRPKRKL